MAKVNEVTIPISSTLEKRLAELIWENCPELARQTVAGKIAMSVEIDDQVVYSVVQHEVQGVVSACIKEKAAILKEQVDLQIDECLKGDTPKAVRASVKRIVDGTHLISEVDKMIRQAVEGEVVIAFRAWIDRHEEAMNKLVESRIDNYLDKALKGAEAFATSAVQKAATKDY